MITSVLHFRLSILLGLLFLSNSLLGQSQGNKVLYPTGLGKFKIGVTTIQSLFNKDTTFAWFKILNYSIDSVTGGCDFDTENDSIGYFRETITWSGEFYNGTNDVKIVLMRGYKILNEKLDLVLVFYKNNLVKITTLDFPLISEQWRLKYGKGKIVVETIKTECSRDEIFSLEKKYVTTWGLPNTYNPLATYKIWNSFNYDCEKEPRNYFNIENTQLVKEIKKKSISFYLKQYDVIENKKIKNAQDSEL